jgi:hypothetical protein
MAVSIPIPGKEGSGTPFRVRHSEKELSEWQSGMFHHKNTLNYSYCLNLSYVPLLEPNMR